MKQRKTVEPIAIRQGDVLLVRVARLPKNATARASENGRIVLAHGEVTGHAHALAIKGSDGRRQSKVPAELFDSDRGTFLQVTGENVMLVHEEHTAHEIPPGIYRVPGQREWTDADEPRQVAD